MLLLPQFSTLSLKNVCAMCLEMINKHFLSFTFITIISETKLQSK